MRVSHHSDYTMPLPEGHPFPMRKYSRVAELLLERGVIEPRELMQPQEAAIDDLLRVHTPAYVERVTRTGLSRDEERRLGVPWSPRLARRSRLAVCGTLLASRAALEDGLAGNLAGGTHHAFPDHGEGFCVFNDVAIAIRKLQAEGRVGRALVVDLDVHQGNGTAAVFEHDARVHTLSLHGERNYPSQKMRSTRDVGLPDGIGDEAYLEVLAHELPAALEAAAPDIVFYLAGVDVAAGDRYGRFQLSEDGVRARERFVVGTVRGAGLPLVITLAGGYAPTPERTAELHALVFEEARALRCPETVA